VPELDGSYTVFGRTAEGFETVEKIASSKTDKYDMPVSEIIIKRAYLDTYFDSEMYEYHRRIAGKE
jgi:peptidyl-prolyl cis-trans isomerase B (cyclophilin B)